MASFNTILDEIATQIAADTDLSDYCAATWGKALNIKRFFKQRTEIQLADLPIMMITRPEVEPEDIAVEVRRYKHRLRLYCGFNEQDRLFAQEELIAFEEVIEDAFMTMERGDTLGSRTVLVEPGIAVNDEGYFHPVYFFVKDVVITATRD